MADDSLEIVDAHMHLWSPTTHPWLEKVKDGGHPAGKFGKARYMFKEVVIPSSQTTPTNGKTSPVGVPMS